MKTSDEYQTPQGLFDELNKEFDFDIDLCANGDNAKCMHYCGDYFNYTAYDLSRLANLKEHFTCFMNPPYSNPLPFIKKAWEDSKHCKIVCLLKVDPSTKWWAIFWNYGEKMGAKPGCEVRFLPKRVKFELPEGISKHECRKCVNAADILDANLQDLDGAYDCKSCGNARYKQKHKGAANFASCVVIFDRRGILKRCVRRLI